LSFRAKSFGARALNTQTHRRFNDDDDDSDNDAFTVQTSERPAQSRTAQYCCHDLRKNKVVKPATTSSSLVKSLMPNKMKEMFDAEQDQDERNI